MLQRPFTLDDEQAVAYVRSLPPEDYFLECDGTVVDNLCNVQRGKLIQLHFRMCGGKGGFGSLLRSFRIHKSSNQLMCRNLQGRRLADVKEEERLKKYISRKAEREKEKQRKKDEKIERLKSGAKTKHEFADQTYLRKRDVILDEVEDAIEAGMSALQKHKEEDVCGEKLKAVSAEEEQQPCSSNDGDGNNGKELAQDLGAENLGDESSGSDVDLDDLMSIGPPKKKNKKF